MAKKRNESFHDWEAKMLKSARATLRYNRATRGLTLDPGERIAATARAKRMSRIDAALRRSIQNQGPRRKK
jgi:hypothetical protein